MTPTRNSSIAAFAPRCRASRCTGRTSLATIGRMSTSSTTGVDVTLREYPNEASGQSQALREAYVFSESRRATGGAHRLVAIPDYPVVLPGPLDCLKRDRRRAALGPVSIHSAEPCAQLSGCLYGSGAADCLEPAVGQGSRPGGAYLRRGARVADAPEEQHRFDGVGAPAHAGDSQSRGGGQPRRGARLRPEMEAALHAILRPGSSVLASTPNCFKKASTKV